MPELPPDMRARQQAAAAPNASAFPVPHAAAPLPAADAARRRRVIRFAALITFIGGIGLSAIPGPKRASHTVATRVSDGVPTQVHKYAYHREFGVPFAVAQADYDDAGAIRQVQADNANFVAILGNLAVSLALVITVVSIARRRRKP